MALGTLFRRIGAPLVLKSDNGSCFVAPAFRTLLARYGVIHLRSPRAWPQYNGACEAGIALLKALTDTAAAGRGEPDQWTTDDLEEARSRANDLSRQIEKRVVPAREEWAGRKPIKVLERRRLQKAVARCLRELGEAPPRLKHHRARLRRKAIQQALVGLGLLDLSSRWVRVRSTGRGSTVSYR